jgi:4-amino-4-deoxy-L-arabinose transferase-like glycosyltransferase
MDDNDPLWQLRHALLGLALALLLSVPLAALIARGLGDLIADSYAWRAGLYSALLAYVVLGAVVLFLRVARHETRPLRLGRLGLWLVSLWLWPLLLARRPHTSRPGRGDDTAP